MGNKIEFTASAMEHINQKIDELHRNYHAEIIKDERKAYTLLQFQPYFMVEKLLGVPRHVQVDGKLRGLTWYQRLYSIFISITVVLVAIQMNSSSNSNFQVDFAFRFILSLLNDSLYVLLTARTCFLGPKNDSLSLFIKLCDLDENLNILGYKGVHRKQYWREVFLLALVLCFYALLIGGVTIVSGYHVSFLIIWFPYAFVETQALLCLTILTALKCRLRHLTRLLETRYLKRREKKDFPFALCGVYDFNFDKIYFVFEKIVDIYKEIRQQFELKILAHMLATSLTTIIVLWELLLTIKKEKITPGHYSVFFMYMVFSFVRLLIFCKVFESFKVAVEEFRVHIFEVIYLAHPAWSAEARTLLSYTEACNSEFSVYGMFHVDITLPFSFLAAMLSLYIALIQFVLI